MVGGRVVQTLAGPFWLVSLPCLRLSCGANNQPPKSGPPGGKSRPQKDCQTSKGQCILGHDPLYQVCARDGRPDEMRCLYNHDGDFVCTNCDFSDVDQQKFVRSPKITLDTDQWDGVDDQMHDTRGYGREKNEFDGGIATASPYLMGPEAQPFGEFLKEPATEATQGANQSDVHVMWASHIEVIPLTEDVGGWLPRSFHERLAEAAVAGLKEFETNLLPIAKKNGIHWANVNTLNDQFFQWQKALWEQSGHVKNTLVKDASWSTPSITSNTTWPQMQGMSEYALLRTLVEGLSRRYLIRQGLSPQKAKVLDYSIFNWVAVNKHADFHGPHMHTGEYHVGVFYAKVPEGSGHLMFNDPRGHTPPFGKKFDYTPRAGELVFFPAWMSHTATNTMTHKHTKDFAGDRVVFSLNVGPESGSFPCHLWWSDPTADAHIQVSAGLDPSELGL